MSAAKQPDPRGRNSVFELKVGARSVAAVHTALLAVALAVAERGKEGGYLVLMDPAISQERLRNEWVRVREVLARGLRTRVGVLAFRNGEYEPVHTDVPGWAVDAAAKLIGPPQEASENRVALGRADYSFVVLQILLRRWLLHEGPVTTTELMRLVGCSYPTVASALKRLAPSLHRHSNRTIELARFPEKEWSKTLTMADRLRFPLRFVDRSGQPQSPAALLRRLEELAIDGVAVGGTMGARHWYADLDLAGDPRLDITVHCPGRQMDYGFVRMLDPALLMTEDAAEPAVILLHALRRAVPLYESGKKGAVWADPVECLLDLHELRLDSQARACIKHLQREVA